MPIECRAELPTEATLPQVLMRVAVQLHDVAALVERAEAQILTQSDADVTHSVEAIAALQGIDLAVQKTRGLAEFLDTVAVGVPDTCTVDLTTALGLVNLSDLKGALQPGSRQSETVAPMKASGDFEFF